MIRAATHFLGANLFLLGMLGVGLAVVVSLSHLATLAGADDSVMRWLYWPIGLVGIVACYYAGKHGHRLVSKLI